MSNSHALWFNPFNSLTWLKCNISPQYPYTFLQKGNKNTQTYQVEIFILM